MFRDLVADREGIMVATDSSEALDVCFKFGFIWAHGRFTLTGLGVFEP